MDRLRLKFAPLDAIDLRIVQGLAENARVSTAELARAVGMSAPSVAERIRRLEDAGVIESYTITINPEAVGLILGAWLRIRPLPGQLAKVAELIAECPDIVESDRVTGDDCYVAKAFVRSVKDLERLIDRLNPYATTNTSIIQSSPMDPRLPPLLPG